jgi:hypothetical protein
MELDHLHFFRISPRQRPKFQVLQLLTTLMQLQVLCLPVVSVSGSRSPSIADTQTQMTLMLKES